MLISKLKHLSSDQFIRNIGWLGIAELINRVFRLATTITLARTFSPYDYGMVSVIYTIVEFASVFALRSGIGAKIIQANESELEDMCNTAYWLNWVIYSSLFILQCCMAYPIALFYGSQQLVLPICVLAFIYLIHPIFIVQSILIEREKRLKITALCNAAQAIISNLILVVLALNGMGIWAVVWSMVLSYPVWIVINYINHSWRPPKSFSLEGWQEITSFGSKLLAVDLLGKLRMNLDYLIVGRFLGIEVLGLYFFAFNAGLGISQSILNSITVALFPHLCAVREDSQKLRSEFLSSLKKIALILVPLITLQTTLSHFYVPIIFGQKWIQAIPILILICLCAVPIALSRANSQLLQASNKVHIDFYWNLAFTLMFAVSLVLVVQGGILWIAATVLITQAVAVPIFTIWMDRFLFKKV